MKALLLITFTLLASCAAADTVGNNQQTTPEKPQTNEVSKTETECKICDFDFETYKGELDKKEVEGLLLALNDEYMATATYMKINEKFDNPRPFVNIIEAEKRHAAKLKELFEKYSVAFPDENPWIGKTPDFESVADACKAGITAEEENVALYDRLFESTKRDDILDVYKNLRRASLENHKPAFERCGSGGGRGMNRGRGNGPGKGNGRNQ